MGNTTQQNDRNQGQRQQDQGQQRQGGQQPGGGPGQHHGKPQTGTSTEKGRMNGKDESK